MMVNQIKRRSSVWLAAAVAFPIIPVISLYAYQQYRFRQMDEKMRRKNEAFRAKVRQDRVDDCDRDEARRKRRERQENPYKAYYDNLPGNEKPDSLRDTDFTIGVAKALHDDVLEYVNLNKDVDVCYLSYGYDSVDDIAQAEGEWLSANGYKVDKCFAEYLHAEYKINIKATRL